MGRGLGVAAKRERECAHESWNESQDETRSPDRRWSWKTCTLRVVVAEMVHEGGARGLVLGRAIWQPIKTMAGQERPETMCKPMPVPRKQGWTDIP